MPEVKYTIYKTTTPGVGVQVGYGEELDTQDEQEAVAETKRRPGSGWTLVRIDSGKRGQEEIVYSK